MPDSSSGSSTGSSTTTGGMVWCPNPLPHDDFYEIEARVPAAGSPWRIETGDLDGDGCQDLVVSGSLEGLLETFRNDCFGAFVQAEVHELPYDAPGLAVADIDDDGNTDVLVADIFARLLRFEGEGSGGLVQAADIPTAGATVAVRVTDLNGDVFPDIVTANLGPDPSVGVLLTESAGSFSSPVQYPTTPTSEVIRLADLNADGMADVVVTAGGVSVLVSVGDGTLEDHVTYEAPAVRTLAIGSLSGDGVPDVVTVPFGEAGIHVLLGIGGALLGPPVFHALPGIPVAVEVADVDGDGRDDAIVLLLNECEVDILLGRGDGTFGTRLRFGVGEWPEDFVVADFNGDGTPDLATANGVSDDISILLSRP